MMNGAVVLAFMFVGWYSFSIAATIYTKDIKTAGVPLPALLTIAQFIIGAAAGGFGMIILNIVPFKVASKEDLRGLLKISAAYSLGHLLTNVSLMGMSPAFSHTVKALEPVSTVILSVAFLGASFSMTVMATLCITVIGVVVASTTELTFTYSGVASVILANFCFSGRNVLVSKTSLDDMNTFFYVNSLSTLLLIPYFLVVEFSHLLSNDISGLVTIKPDQLLAVSFMFVICGLVHFLYNQLSFAVLVRTSPVSHSVGNSMRRVFIITASVLYFRTPMDTINLIGTVLACSGSGLYAYVKAKENAAKKAQVQRELHSK